jgi:hypothetical protein
LNKDDLFFWTVNCWEDIRHKSFIGRTAKEEEEEEEEEKVFFPFKILWGIIGDTSEALSQVENCLTHYFKGKKTYLRKKKNEDVIKINFIANQFFITFSDGYIRIYYVKK